MVAPSLKTMASILASQEGAMLYHVVYDTPCKKGVTYCVCPMPREVAEKYLENFKRLYLNPDGTGKPYPNGRGAYQFTNPRIRRATREEILFAGDDIF